MVENYYSTLDRGTSRPAQDLEAAFAGMGKQETSTSDVLGAAASSIFTGSAAVRAFERRSSQFIEDETWTVTEDMETDLISEYSPKDLDYLKQAGSKDEFLARKAYLKEDDDRSRVMMSNGWTGVAAMVGFSLVDPASWALSAGTGSIGWIKKGSAVARAAKLGTAVGLENVAIDSMLMAGDTNMEASHLIMSFGAGAIIGSGLGALSKRSDNIRTANEIDAATSADAENLIIRRSILDNLPAEQRPIRREFPDADARAVQAEADAFEATLRGTIGAKVSRTDAIAAKKQIADLEEQIANNQARMEADIADLSGSTQRVLDGVEAPDVVMGKRAAIESQMATRVEKIKAEIARLEGVTRKSTTEKDLAALMKADDELIEAGKAVERAVAREMEGLRAKAKGIQRKSAKKIAKLERSYVKAAKELARKIKPLQDMLDTVPRARQAERNLQEWRRLSLKEKVEFLYGEGGPPSRTTRLAEEKAGRSDITFVPDGAAPPPVQGGIEGKAGSVGAAEAGFTDININTPYSLNEVAQQRLDRLSDLGADGAEEVRGSMLPFRSTITDAIHSVQAMISNSRSYAIRGFGYLLFEAPQGGKAGATTAAIRKQVYDNKIRGAMRNRLNEGVYEFGRENGLGRYASLMNRAHIERYNKEVMIEVMRPGTSTSPAVQKGAEGVRDQLQTAGKIRKDAGEAGFENIDLDANYVPIVMDPFAIKRNLRSGAHPQSRVREVISLAYQQGGFKLDRATADRLADAQIKRSLDDTLVMSDQARGVTNKDMDELRRGLEKAGVDKEIIDDIINDSMDKEIRKHMSNRAKKSLRPRIDVEFENLKFIDLIDNDLPKILESYTRDSSGGAAFAKLGYTTRSQVLDQISQLEMDAIQRLNMPQAQIDREIKALRESVDLLYGRTLNKDNPGLVKALSRARDLTGLLRLQFVGAASIPELARVTSQYSLSSVLEACKDLGAIRGTKNLREGGKYSGHLRRKDLDELEEVYYYSGEDSILYSNGLRADDIEESEVVGRIGRYFDRAAAQGRRLAEVSSGFRLIQGTGERLAVRSLALDIKKMIAGTGKPLRQSSIDRAGWSDGFLDELGEFMRNNPKTERFGDKDITLFNFGKMSPDMQERLQIGMHRLVRADMQRPNIGETPMFMNKWLGQTFTQFRSFSILSMEKQLVHDFKHDKAMGALIAMQSAMYAYIGVGIASLQRNLGKEDADEKIKRDMSGTNLVMGVMNRMGQLAALGIGMDVLATAGVLPEDIVASRDQVGARAMTASSIPVAGLAKDVLEVPSSIAGALKGEIGASKVVKDVQDVLPFGKTIGINQAINVLRGSLD